MALVKWVTIFPRPLDLFESLDREIKTSSAVTHPEYNKQTLEGNVCKDIHNKFTTPVLAV